MFAVLDEQSNKALAKSDFFHLLNITTSVDPHTLKPARGSPKLQAGRAKNVMNESVDGKHNFTFQT